MPFIPHTDAEVSQMLEVIGADSIAELFDEIPSELQCGGLGVNGDPGAVGEGMNEMAVAALMQPRAKADGVPSCFIGAGAYDHHIPAAVWELAGRGEYYSAYTPYQAEASQGTLQLIFEFQTMIANLTAMEVSNASLYDGASALAEAVLMAVRANRGTTSKRILIPRSLNPRWRRVVHTIVHNQGIELVEVNFGSGHGTTALEQLHPFAEDDFAALVIPQPNFFGALENVNELTDWAHARRMMVIAVVNPVAMAQLSPPGEWGEKGADIAVGEGQPLGIPLSSGGPYLGFISSRQALVRQMPGRIVGETVDNNGQRGFTLTLQAREQHIRRSKATSNICTNQGLLAVAATIHMALLGPQGLAQVAAACHENTRKLLAALTAIEGVERCFEGPFFHEVVIKLSQPVEEVLKALAVQDLLGGYPLAGDYPELENTLLICATEKYGEEMIEGYASHLRRILSRRQPLPPCQKKIPENREALGFSAIP